MKTYQWLPIFLQVSTTFSTYHMSDRDSTCLLIFNVCCNRLNVSLRVHYSLSLSLHGSRLQKAIIVIAWQTSPGLEADQGSLAYSPCSVQPSVLPLNIAMNTLCCKINNKVCCSNIFMGTIKYAWVTFQWTSEMISSYFKKDALEPLWCQK